MDNALQHLVVGTFLHDIGKVMQRAEASVSEGTRNFMGAQGPTRNGVSSHFHVQWTSQFFEEHFPSGMLPYPDSIDDDAHHLAFRHHNPSNSM